MRETLFPRLVDADSDVNNEKSDEKLQARSAKEAKHSLRRKIHTKKDVIEITCISQPPARYLPLVMAFC